MIELYKVLAEKFKDI